jgi:hypothetical protein
VLASTLGIHDAKLVETGFRSRVALGENGVEHQWHQTQINFNMYKGNKHPARYDFFKNDRNHFRP